jgi:hypothetical protein
MELLSAPDVKLANCFLPMVARGSLVRDLVWRSGKTSVGMHGPALSSDEAE